MADEKTEKKGSRTADLLNNGLVLTLGALGVAAAVQVATEGVGPIRAVFPKKRGARASFFGPEGATVSVSQAPGSAARKKPRKAKSGGPSAYQQFVAKRIPQYRSRGLSAKDAMSRAAADWRNR